MKTRRILSLLLACAMMFALVACSSDAPSSSSTPGSSSAASSSTPESSAPSGGGEATYNWKLGHGLATDHPYQIGSEEFARLCKENSGGQIHIDIFPSSQLGSEREMYESIQMGTLDFTPSTTSPLVNFDESFYIFDMPFLFKDKEHAYRVLDGEIGQQKLDSLSNFGMKGLAFWECGLFNFVYSGDPIKTPADVKGRTIRTMESEVTMTWISALGANPVPMAWSEVFTAIQNGTVDGTILPITTTFFNKIYTVAPNYSILNMTYSPLPLVMSKKTWDPLPDDIKQVVQDAAIEARDYMRDYTTSVEDESLATMKEEGTNVITFTDEERQVWIDTISAEAYPKMIPSMFTQDEIDAVKALEN